MKTTMQPCLTFLLLPTLLGSIAVAMGAGSDQLKNIPGWGEVLDPDGDCELSFEKGTLKVAIPGKDHALAVERRQMNAPRVLQEVKGDFVAQVKVSGDFATGAISVVKERRGFQGAGLVLWQDDQNYIRLERAQLVVGQRTYSYASFELRRKGEFEIAGDASEHPMQGKETYLKLERRGDKVTASVSTDGVQWAMLDPMKVKLPDTVRIGVVAGHNTSTAITAEFEGLKVTRLPATEGEK